LFIEILKEEILAPRKISQIKLAQEINVPPKKLVKFAEKKEAQL
jgi:plasmid maintenance system antidote protein VapI